MKRSVCLIFTWLLTTASNGQGLKIFHLDGDFYVFTSYKNLDGKPFPANGMYTVTDEGVIMFDTPWDTADVEPLLDSIASKHGKKVVLSVSTHFHNDRTGGVDILKRRGVKTYCSKMTYDLCKQRNERQPEFYFQNDTTFSLGKYQFETFYPGAGHTRDNIVVWCGGNKILYGGCFVKSTESPGLGNVDDADVKEWKKSVKKVMKRFPKPAYIVPGHFDWESNKSLAYTLKLIKEAK